MEMLILSLGILGMVLILAGFFLLETHRLSADSLTYDALNFVGSVFLVINAISTHAWPFLILNTIWGLVAFRDCIIDLRRDRVPLPLTPTLSHKGRGGIPHAQ